ncbi:hypothetical protein GCM10010483_16270 [Actinokineospora diospyrosa]
MRGPYDTRGRTAKQGPKSMALLRTTLRLPSPHTKQVHPIEHLAPASPTVQVLGWQGSRERAGMAPPGPTVHGLSRWVRADLTEAGVAPQGPSVQALGKLAGADLTGAGWHRRVRLSRGWHCGLGRTLRKLRGTGGFEERGAGLVGLTRWAWEGTDCSERPVAGLGGLGRT